MRQNTSDPDLESPTTFDAKSALVMSEKKGLVPRLGKVEVYVLGVDNASKPIAYWERLRWYWIEYFKKAGANVQSYSILREFRVPEP